MGERADRRRAEVDALRYGIERGLTLIDTAEMYGEGEAERIVAEAVEGRRDGVFIVSKVYPHNATRRGTAAACERSLKRLKTDRIDLYLLHWQGNVPLAESVAALDALQEAGKIRHWGVSNLDVEAMEEVVEAPRGLTVATNQILYNLGRRGPEFGLIPFCRERRIPLMAYSPVEQGALPNARPLRAMADRLGTTPARIALAWLLRQGDVMVIPKATSREHVDDNLGALELRLGKEELAELDRLYPPPAGPSPLEML